MVYIMQIFSKWRLKIFSGGNHPPYPRTLTANPTPVLLGTPDFVNQNDNKGCKRDYLDAPGHFNFRSGAIGNKPLGGVLTTPLGR